MALIIYRGTVARSTRGGKAGDQMREWKCRRGWGCARQTRAVARSPRAARREIRHVQGGATQMQAGTVAERRGRCGDKGKARCVGEGQGVAVADLE
jgi:hypothetical protein